MWYCFNDHDVGGRLRDARNAKGRQIYCLGFRRFFGYAGSKCDDFDESLQDNVLLSTSVKGQRL